MSVNVDELQCSVIVPVYNQWHLVPKLIDRLANQSIGQTAFELLLIDNGSSQLPDSLDLPLFARLLHCQKPGSYTARNHGIQYARGKYLVFTDADCLPSPQWLEQGLQCINQAERPDQTIVAGGIKVVPFDESAINAYELYDMTLGLLQEHYVRMGYGTTANLFFAQANVDRVGCFDESRYSGGDAEFCRRASQYGVELQYCAAALIYHPARARWQELAHKARRIKGGQIRHGKLRRRMTYIARTVVPPIWAWRRIFQSRSLTVGQRLLLCTIKARLWGVELTEIARLLLGGRPVRT